MRLSSSCKVIMSLLVLTFFAVSCHNPQRDKQKGLDTTKDIEKRMQEINSRWVDIEDKAINKLIQDSGWRMNETGSGLRYMLLENGNGENAKKGQTVDIEYSVSLLNGQLIYSSDRIGLKTFEVGKGQVESGLDEGILYLKLGDKARFILPSHLAFGLQGDRNLIPGKASLLYELELMNIHKNEKK